MLYMNASQTFQAFAMMLRGCVWGDSKVRNCAKLYVCIRVLAQMYVWSFQPRVWGFPHQTLHPDMLSVHISVDLVKVSENCCLI